MPGGTIEKNSFVSRGEPGKAVGPSVSGLARGVGGVATVGIVRRQRRFHNCEKVVVVYNLGCREPVLPDGNYLDL